jgi:hypothetical protein
MAPRRTAQHTIFILRIVPILAPLPHVASHIIQPILICREAPDRTRPRVPIFIAFDHGTAFRFVSNPRLLSAVITRSRRRRPLRTPWIKVYLGTLLFRRISGFRIQSHCYTPFNVGRQPVMHALGQRTGTAFSLGQPFAKRFHIVPAYAHDRIRWALSKPRLLPGCTAPLPPAPYQSSTCLPSRRSRRSRRMHKSPPGAYPKC